MSEQSPDKGNAADPQDLRRQIDHTREELGRTVEQLAAKADVKANAQRRAAELKEQARERATHVTHLVKDKTPAPVREKAGQAAGVRWDKRGPLLAVSTTLLVFWLVQRLWRRR
ncbi:DUF3618 domain-containing protein [Streptomyces sp. BYX5S]